MAKISAVVNTLNEEDNIKRCLKSLSFAHQIVVVDMESEDNTVSIAKKYTDDVHTHKKMGYVEPARNFAISKATGDWILLVDADEEIPKTLAQKLIEIADKNEVDFVRIPRKNIIFDSWVQHSRWWPDRNVRFFKKGSVTWKDEIHSIPITFGKGENLGADEKLAITHHHYQTIEQYLTRMFRYSQIQSKQLLAEGYKFSPKDIIIKPFSEFLSRFFAGEGYKDGLHGLILALLQAFSEFILYLQIWQKQGFAKTQSGSFYSVWFESLKDISHQFSFWHYTMKLHLEKNKYKKIILKIKRKLT